MTETEGSRGTGRLARWLHFLVTHQVPVGGGPVHRAHPPPGVPTVGLVSCHFVAHGFGDQVVDRVERALDRRGHVVGRLAALDRGAPVVVVAHAGPRARPTLRGVDVAGLAGRAVGLVTYGPSRPCDPASSSTLRAELSAAGARVVDLVAVLDVAGLHRPGTTSRGGSDPFGLLTLELVLDDLLDAPRAPDRGVDPLRPSEGVRHDRRNR